VSLLLKEKKKQIDGLHQTKVDKSKTTIKEEESGEEEDDDEHEEEEFEREKPSSSVSSVIENLKEAELNDLFKDLKEKIRKKQELERKALEDD
jgi:hypothetical protein